MKVTVVRGGGLGGLVTTSSIDSGSLSDQDAQALRTSVERAGILDPATAAGTPAGHADAQSYAVTVEDGGTAHTVRVGDPLPEGIRSLIAWIDAAPGAEQEITPVTGA